jgi:hypothetical protein
MSDSEITKPTPDEERILLLNQVIRERFGEWATRKDNETKKDEEAR